MTNLNIHQNVISFSNSAYGLSIFNRQAPMIYLCIRLGATIQMDYCFNSFYINNRLPALYYFKRNPGEK